MPFIKFGFIGRWQHGICQHNIVEVDTYTDDPIELSFAPLAQENLRNCDIVMAQFLMMKGLWDGKESVGFLAYKLVKLVGTRAS